MQRFSLFITLLFLGYVTVSGQDAKGHVRADKAKQLKKKAAKVVYEFYDNIPKEFKGNTRTTPVDQFFTKDALLFNDITPRAKKVLNYWKYIQKLPIWVLDHDFAIQIPEVSGPYQMQDEPGYYCHVSVNRELKGLKTAPFDAESGEFSFEPKPISNSRKLCYTVWFQNIENAAATAKIRSSTPGDTCKTIRESEYDDVSSSYVSKMPSFALQEFVDIASSSPDELAKQEAERVQPKPNNAYLSLMEQGEKHFYNQRIEAALHLFEQALEEKSGDPIAINNINVCRASLGVLKFEDFDYKASYRVLSRFEQQDYFKRPQFAYAQYALGIIYLKGKGVKKDHDKAYYWLKKASDNGIDGACRVLNRLGLYDCF